jgi:hypothetical protein
LSIVGQVLAWLACLVVVVSVNVERAAHAGEGDIHFQQGYAAAGILISFAVAIVLGLVIRRSRHRHGVPVWAGLIAIAVSVGLAIMDVGEQGVAQAVDRTACVPLQQAYGTPPAGWRYSAVDAATKDKIVNMAKLDSTADVKYARRGEDAVVLIGVPHANRSFVDGAVHGARKVGATVAAGPGGSRLASYPNGAAYMAVGVHGCNAVLVDGRNQASVETVARAIF